MDIKLSATLNIFIPLAIGLCIYLFFHNTTIINIFVNTFFVIKPLNCNGQNFFIYFLKCWACDILWAYSLFFALFYILKPFKSRIMFAAMLSIFLSIFVEILQYIQIINGTFDILDITFEITVIIFAVIILKRRCIL